MVFFYSPWRLEGRRLIAGGFKPMNLHYGTTLMPRNYGAR